jgi:large subunit ribosomal protein L6e
MQKKTIDEARVADQKAVDASLLAAVGKVENLKAYLGSYFSLSNGQFPHQLKF